MPLRYRTLPASEITSQCYRIAIDDYYINGLVVVVYYPNSAGTAYNLYSFSYGNLATAVKVIPPTIPIYFTFTYPTGYTSMAADSSTYQWDFLTVGSSSTQYASYR